jgi:hypothetical protein
MLQLGKDFDRDAAYESPVGRGADLPHSALAEQPQDLIGP